jgi:hypothetical protein
MMTFNPAPPLPAEPSVDAQRALQIELRAHGSPEVSDAFHDYVQKARRFQIQATAYETVLKAGAQLSNERETMETAREQAREAADRLQRLASDELASF